MLIAAGLPFSSSAQVAEQTNRLFNDAEAMYARGDYINASNGFLDVAAAAARQDLSFAQRALERAGDSVCLAQFEGARSLIKNGLRQRAEALLDAALTSKRCERFGDRLQWARQQKTLMARPAAKRNKADSAQ